jgi:hypothetical protein
MRSSAEETVSIHSRDYWFKIVEYLQQNWALIDEVEDSVSVYFISDTSYVFDKLRFDSVQEARDALILNGFGRFDEDPEAADFLSCPSPPFHGNDRPYNGIYSSGGFWIS